MSEKAKIYHVETQEDYDDLMIKLEGQGYKWINGDKPTCKPEYWSEQKEDTTVLLNGFKNFSMTRGPLEYHKRSYPFTPIIKYKAKGVNQMEKVVVPQFLADWYEKNKTSDLYALLGKFSSEFISGDQSISEWATWCEGRNLFRYDNSQEVIAKMHLYGYEVEEKKYYWRKKKEYMFEFELRELSYLRIHRETKRLMFSTATESGKSQALLTETQVRRAVSEEDFNKLEKVEITE